MTRYESLRASDADRDAVTDRLRDAAVDGRLDPEELEQRVDAALRARTYGELRRLVADLPGEARAPWRRSAQRSKPLVRSALVGTGLLVALTVAVAVVALLVLAAAAWWMVFVVFCLVRCGLRRRSMSAPPRRHSMHPRRPRPTGLL